MEATGTKSLEEVLDLAVGLVKSGQAVMADGKISMADAPALFALIPLLGPAMVGAGEIPAEIKAISEEEAAALVAHVMSKLSLDNGKAYDIVNASFKMLSAGVALAKAIKE